MDSFLLYFLQKSQVFVQNTECTLYKFEAERGWLTSVANFSKFNTFEDGRGDNKRVDCLKLCSEIFVLQ